jgi:hypothetical protein
MSTNDGSERSATCETGSKDLSGGTARSMSRKKRNRPRRQRPEAPRPGPEAGDSIYTGQEVGPPLGQASTPGKEAVAVTSKTKITAKKILAWAKVLKVVLSFAFDIVKWFFPHQ